MAQRGQFSPADIAMLWDNSKRTMFHTRFDGFFFYDVPDLVRARELGFDTPVDVVHAYLAGNTEDTHSINLARLHPGGEEWYGGNVAYHVAVRGHTAKFAQSKIAAAAFAESIRQGDPNVQGMLDIPLKLCQPERGPWLEWQRVYVEPRSGYDPDSTSFLASQADWTRESPAPATSILEPLESYHVWVPFLYDNNGINVLGINGRPLRAFDHILPRRISTKIIEDDHILAGWFLSDPRVTAEDIIDRMLYPQSPQGQQFLRATIYQKADKWCKNNQILSIFTDSDLATDKDIVAGLTDLQCKHNTTWELDVASETVRRPGTQTWYSTSWLHTTSPLIRGYQGGVAHPYSPRVIKARYTPLDYELPVDPARKRARREEE